MAFEIRAPGVDRNEVMCKDGVIRLRYICVLYLYCWKPSYATPQQYDHLPNIDDIKTNLYDSKSRRDINCLDHILCHCPANRYHTSLSPHLSLPHHVKHLYLHPRRAFDSLPPPRTKALSTHLSPSVPTSRIWKIQPQLPHLLHIRHTKPPITTPIPIPA